MRDQNSENYRQFYCVRMPLCIIIPTCFFTMPQKRVWIFSRSAGGGKLCCAFSLCWTSKLCNRRFKVENFKLMMHDKQRSGWWFLPIAKCLWKNRFYALALRRIFYLISTTFYCCIPRKKRKKKKDAKKKNQLVIVQTQQSTKGFQSLCFSLFHPLRSERQMFSLLETFRQVSALRLPPQFRLAPWTSE